MKSTEEMMLLNCGAGEDSWRSLGLQGDLKGNQSWILLRRTDAEAKVPILWPPDAKSWLIGKDSDSGKDCGQEEKGSAEDEMAAWSHQFNGHEPGQTPGDSVGQWGLACCSPLGHKELNLTWQLNNKNIRIISIPWKTVKTTWNIFFGKKKMGKKVLERRNYEVAWKMAEGSGTKPWKCCPTKCLE